MKICTINIPDEYLECIEVLVEMGFYPSRSEAVRAALKEFLTRETEIMEGLKPENFKKIKEEQLGLIMRYSGK